MNADGGHAWTAADVLVGLRAGGARPDEAVGDPGGQPRAARFQLADFESELRDATTDWLLDRLEVERWVRVRERLGLAPCRLWRVELAEALGFLRRVVEADPDRDYYKDQLKRFEGESSEAG